MHRCKKKHRRELEIFLNALREEVPKNICAFTCNVRESSCVECPVAHGPGRAGGAGITLVPQFFFALCGELFSAHRGI